ncbi:MAG: TonB-dependent receptor [Bacteroidia bacterium]|nr:TonB-dependent receptor [Bacteroidia bacterium]
MKVVPILISFLLYGFQLTGQSISGNVEDNMGVALVGVNIVNLSSGRHTYTDENGSFQLGLTNRLDTIQFSYLGYETMEKRVDEMSDPVVIILSEQIISLSEIVVLPRLDATNLIADIDIQTNPVNSSQEVLQKVPGLFIGQHAGGGKAEQIFLRGFDIDHGTDINITVDGLPVNMVSHAHGQGYADLHFLIPETIDRIDFGKGPYYADQGNFNTAGYVNFKTKDRLDHSLLKFESGSFNTQRILGLLDIVSGANQNAYLASEYTISDGPFESPQNFDRFNIIGKYQRALGNGHQLGIAASYFASKWDASGQIPQRAVDDGLITRFGAIDDTEGGETSRMNVLLTHKKILDHHSFVKSSTFYTYYDFELFSNFTFFLRDPINGDQIKQRESRNILGLVSEYNRTLGHKDISALLKIGISLRHDISDSNELAYTLNRVQTLEQIQFGNIHETNLGVYINTAVDLGKWTVIPAIRLDYFNFQYDDLLTTDGPLSESKPILTPKISVLFNQTQQLQWYIKTGKGFHSNDSRVVVSRKGQEILPAAYGADVGFIWKPIPKLIMQSAYWYLFLEQEFVYVGDEGIVEPSGKTTRQGWDLSLRYQPLDWLYTNFDFNYTYARSNEAEAGFNYIPLAPELTYTGGLQANHPSGFYGGINMRHLKDRPANEDNSIVAEGYTIVDINAGYSWRKFDFSFQIQNLFDVAWNETQFATESRLLDEPHSVEEIHFTPGAPFMLKGMISYKF